MRKKPDLRYVDMAIYVDENVHKPGHDVKKIYDYLTMLAYMLAVKRKFFNHEWYYDRFSEYLARITYMRIIKGDRPQYRYEKVKLKVQYDKCTKEQKERIDELVLKRYPAAVKRNDVWMKPVGEPLKEGDKGWLTPITSCLNYMKQVLYVKKCQFVAEEFEYTTNTNNSDLVDAFKNYTHKSVLNVNNDLLVCDVELYFKTITNIIKNEIQNGVYGNDKLMVWKLYTSCLLSLLRNFIPSNKNQKKIDRSVDKLTYTEEVLTDIMQDETASAAVVYDLPDEYIDYVAYLLQRIKTQIIKDIRELSAEYSMSDEMVEDILMLSLAQSEE